MCFTQVWVGGGGLPPVARADGLAKKEVLKTATCRVVLFLCNYCIYFTGQYCTLKQSFGPEPLIPAGPS